LSLNPASKQSLSAEQWAVAALDALAVGGLEAVAVEPLARSLGVTKGSFYWHFANRDALLQAALALWEQRESAAVIARAEQEATPLERMLTLFRELANTDVRTEKLLLALSGSEHPLVRAAAQRVSARWRAYVQDCYRALGYTEQDAAHWATFAFCIFMGTVRMRRDDPEALPEGGRFNDYLRFLIRTLLPKSRDDADTASAADHPHVVPLKRGA
jgi:AcrR family transcriptional regulator